MCGFLGQYSTNLSSKDSFLKVLNIAQHRGPDQQGYWSNEEIQLGFNRLAIQDLSGAGHQPMHSNSNNWVVVFNGEVYNHLELRKKTSHYSFKGHSDTETIVASLEKYGFEKTISELIGMFAIAAYNKQTNQLFIARDSVGIKPLFYCKSASNLWFASQFNQVVNGLGKSNVSLTKSGTREFLQFGYMQAPNTIYREVKQLEPGQYLEVSNNSIKLSYYKQWPAKGEPEIFDEDSVDSVNHFNELFSEVIYSQLQADVPLNSFLSSGIDSTLVSAFARNINKELKTFTIGLGGGESDERSVAKKYADLLDTDHYSEALDPNEFSNKLDDHFLKLGEPFADYSSIPTYFICKSARKNSTVMLSGDGGDELFWGYNRMSKFSQSYYYFKDSLGTRRLKKKLKITKPAASGAVYDFKGIDEMAWNVHSHIFNADKIVPQSSFYPETRELYRFKGNNQKEFRNWLRYNEFYGHMQRVLIKVDRMSMASSLEVRVPLLDQRIVDFAWQLKSSFGLIENHRLKPFLKDRLAEHLPQELINQKKKGFTFPLSSWLKNELKEEVLDLLHSDIYGQEYLDKEVWNQYIKMYYSEQRNISNEWGIWIMYSWQKWMQQMDSFK